MKKIFILHYVSSDSKEYIVLRDDFPTPIVIFANRLSGYEFERYVECDVVFGNANMLPMERPIKPVF